MFAGWLQLIPAQSADNPSATPRIVAINPGRKWPMIASGTDYVCKRLHLASPARLIIKKQLKTLPER